MTKLKVILKSPHTHEEVDYAAGTEIEVGEHDAKWLEDNGVIDAPAAAGKGTAPVKETKA